MTPDDGGSVAFEPFSREDAERVWQHIRQTGDVLTMGQYPEVEVKVDYKQPTPEIQGWMGKDSLAWLYERAQQMESIVEIGSWKGRSTHALLSGCRGPVFAVDHFKGSPDELNGAHGEAARRDIFPDFWQNVGGFRNLVLFRMESTEAAKYFAPKSVDMVFIDGCHMKQAVMADINAWAPKCRKLLCGHDAGYKTVQEAIRDCGFTNTRENGGMWIVTP